MSRTTKNKIMTAVEYLIEQLQAPCRGIPSHIIEQAKQLEKQQIIDAFNSSYDVNLGEFVNGDYIIGKSYYNETYGSNGSDVPELRYKDGTPIRSYDSPKIQAMVELMNEPDTFSQTEISDSTITDQIDGIIFQLPLDDKLKLWKLIDELVEENIKKISDEDIEKGAKEWYNKEGAYSASAIALKTWVYAIRWYREQLKK